MPNDKSWNFFLSNLLTRKHHIYVSTQGGIRLAHHLIYVCECHEVSRKGKGKKMGHSAHIWINDTRELA